MSNWLLKREKRMAKVTDPEVGFSRNDHMLHVVAWEGQLMTGVVYCEEVGKVKEGRRPSLEAQYLMERLAYAAARNMAHHAAAVLRGADVEWALWEIEGRGE